jgi:hypothetical protein
LSQWTEAQNSAVFYLNQQPLSGSVLVEQNEVIMETAPLTVSEILERLARNSRRPRYALMVLTLLSEAADRRGQAGPFVEVEGQRLPVRLWLGGTLAKMSAHHKRRADMRERINQTMAAAPHDATSDSEIATKLEQRVTERARDVGGANISRAVTDLVRCGLVTRQYVGNWTRHARKGGHRHAAYVVSQDALAALRRGAQLL